MKKHKNLIIELGASFVVLAILYLFYDTFLVVLAFPGIFWLCRKVMLKEAAKKKKDELNIEFKDMLLSMTAAMRAGYSVENSLKEAFSEMKLTYGPDSEICKELSIMLGQLGLGLSAENVFFDFAARSGVEDINTFASVFRIAKRSGGDMVEIMRKTSADISAKVNTRNEISVLISAKRLEMNIMMLMPAGIIVYLKFSSDGLLDPLYKNATGILIMTICLGLYALAWYMGRRITDIEV